MNLTARLFLLSTLTIVSSDATAGDVIVRTGFEAGAIDAWTLFRQNTTANVALSDGKLLGRRSSSGGLVALTRNFDPPPSRVMIEFSFAFGGPSRTGRSLNVWTHEPGGTDASQFNLCIQRAALQQFDGRTRSWEVITTNVEPSPSVDQPVWHRLRAIVDSTSPAIDYWISKPNGNELPKAPTATVAAYRTKLPIGAIDFVSGTRIAEGNWYLIDDLVVTAGSDLPAPGKLPADFELWTGPPIPSNLEEIPFVAGIEHSTIHHATEDGYKFLHGAAIVHYKGTLFANWANSPTNENGPHETLQGRRSTDGGRTWSDIEVIGPGFAGPDRHSHGVLFVHKGELWTICSRFGVGVAGRRFPGLKGEAFVLNETTDKWESRGIVMHNCWPYDEPVRLDNGDFITGGQDKDGLPVVAVSHGDDLTKWDSILIPYPPALAPSFAETTVLADGSHVIAVIRGGGGVAWVSTSDDFGRTWTRAQRSNLPMPRAKAYLGQLSTGQWYLLSNLKNRDTLVISVSKPGERTLSRMLRIRHGRSGPPRFKGAAKGKQWSYPYGHEHDGKLYVVYSIGKEDCGLSVLPVSSLAVD